MEVSSVYGVLEPGDFVEALMEFRVGSLRIDR